jgi:hypothetical protein
VWFLAPRPGINAADRECFELVQFTVDGKDRPIRRSQRKTGQTYSVDIGENAVRQGKPVTVRHVYRTVTAKDAHGLLVAVTAPIHGLALAFDYTDTDIAKAHVADLAPQESGVRYINSTPNLPERIVGTEVPGWLLPQTRFTFVWTLASETTSLEEPHSSTTALVG